MMAVSERHFGPELFEFLRALRRNNRRDWFQANRERYEEHLRHPSLQFISDFGPRLRQISPHFAADPRPVGGSLFRIHRDVRFSADKSPYKTHVGIRFRHREAKQIHSPGFYLHLEPGACFAGIGVWHPDGTTLGRIRSFLIDHPEAWRRTIAGRRFGGRFDLGGDRLKRAPRGIDPQHPLIEDLKRKDFVAYAPLADEAVTAPGFLADYARDCRAGAPFVRLLCEAVGVPF